MKAKGWSQVLPTKSPFPTAGARRAVSPTHTPAMSKISALIDNSLSLPAAHNEVTEDTVVASLVMILKQHGGSMPVVHCCTALYKTHPSFKAVVQAAGGFRALCAKHNELLFSPGKKLVGLNKNESGDYMIA